MVFEKLKERFSGNDEKYEVLYFKYSKIKLENQKLKEEHIAEMRKHKEGIHESMANNLIAIFEDIETAKNDSFKIKATDKDIQRLLMDVNKVEKHIKDVMKDFSIEEIVAQERFFDPDLHEVASYDDAKGMAKGIIMKTVKKGFKYKNKMIKKPRVVVTK